MAAGQQRRKFTPEFRDEAVRLVLDTGPGAGPACPRVGRRARSEPVVRSSRVSGSASLASV